MTIDSALKIGLSGLNASQFALTQTANNIANVNTEGYVRKTVQLENKILGSEAAGVDIGAVRRVIDTFLQKEQRVASAQFKRYETLSLIHERLQSLLGAPNDNISFPGRLDRALDAIADTVAEPDSAVRRLSAVTELQAYSDEINRISKLLQDLRAESDRRISEALTTVNNAILRIDDLNPLIARAQNLGSDATGLVEQRDRAIAEIGEIIDVTTRTLTSGFLSVTTTSGVILIDQLPRKLVYDPAGSATTQTQFSQIGISRVNRSTGALTDTGAVLDPNIRTGTLRGLIDIRNTELPRFASELGRLSGAVIDQLNGAHNDNSTVPAQSTLTGRNVGLLATDLHAGFTGKVALATLSSTGTLVNRVVLDFDANTIALNGGAAAAFSGTTFGDVVADVNTNLGAGTLSLSVGALTFKAPTGAAGVAALQDTTTPSARGGRGFAHFFGLNDLMAANVAPQFDTGFAGTDAHSFGSTGILKLAIKGPNGETAKTFDLDLSTAGATTFTDIVNALNAGISGFGAFALDSKGALSFTPTATFKGYSILSTSDTTSRGASAKSLTDLFGIGDRFVQDAAFGVTVRSDILSDNTKLALAKLDLTTAGALAGTTPAVTPGDNRGVISLQDVATSSFSIAAAGNVAATTTTLTNFAAVVMSDFAVQAEQATSLKEDNEALIAELNARVSSVSGVNLDEELANMVLFQTAYNASARMVATTQELFDVLLSIV